jgi:hypothetical protein
LIRSLLNDRDCFVESFKKLKEIKEKNNGTGIRDFNMRSWELFGAVWFNY